MRPELGRNDSFLAYLEPPHLHDPSSVSGVASLPPATLQGLPDTVQAALYNLQQSTSIVYASFIRFQELLQERFDRLNPSLDEDGEYTFSEPSFMTYTNSLDAERSYLLSGALTDWRHKASLTRVAIQPYDDTPLAAEAVHSSDLSSTSTIAEWWEYLESAVQSWCEYARAIHVPDYEDTIGEFLAMEKLEPSLTADSVDKPLETPAMPTSIMEELEAIQICEIKERDFALPVFTGDVAAVKGRGLGLGETVGVGSFAGVVAQEFPLDDEGKGRDERKDSGVCIDG